MQLEIDPRGVVSPWCVGHRARLEVEREETNVNPAGTVHDDGTGPRHKAVVTDEDIGIEFLDEV